VTHWGWRGVPGLDVLRILPLLLTLAVVATATPAWAQCSVGTPIQYGCGTYIPEGCCDGGDTLYWCEKGWTCRLSCVNTPACGWNQSLHVYACNTAGSAAPNNNPPYDCNDLDGDGYTPPSDCNDSDPNIHPGQKEVCNGIDDDCDGHADNGYDNDGDGWSTCMGDCDDGHSDTYPGAPETPYDGVDQNCDGHDLDDIDQDGFVGGQNAEDCDDEDAAIHPDADEICNDGVDNDCDNFIDGTDPDCGGGDDDTADDDDGGDDDTIEPTGDDDDAGAAEATGPEPFGFGCRCKASPGALAGPAGVIALVLVGLLRRRH